MLYQSRIHRVCDDVSNGYRQFGIDADDPVVAVSVEPMWFQAEIFRLKAGAARLIC